MNGHVYAIEIPLADGYTMYEICRTDTPAKVGEVVSVLLSAKISVPATIRVVVHPATAVTDPFAGQ